MRWLLALYVLKALVGLNNTIAAGGEMAMEITSIRSQVIPESAPALSDTQDNLNRGLPDNQTQLLTAQLGWQQQLTTVQGDAFGYVRDIANAAIAGILSLMNSVTTLFEPLPGMPSSGGAVAVPPPAPSERPATSAPAVSTEPSTQPTPAGPQSLIPPWAQLFKLTGDCEFRPGGPSSNAYIDFRGELKGKIQKLEILSADGTNVLAAGTPEGITNNGKPRYRLNAKGADLPKGAILKATLKDTAEGNAGGIRYIEIPKPDKKFVW